MAWNGYIDNLIGQCKDNADAFAIIGLDGSIWTTETHEHAIKITPTEAAVIGKALTAKTFDGLQANGIMIAGVKYQYLRGEENILMGKKKDCGSVTLQASKKAVIIGHTKEGCQHGVSNAGIAVIAEYLDTLGM